MPPLTGALMSGSVGLTPRIHGGGCHWCMDDILSLVMSMMTGAALDNLTGALMSGSVGLTPRIHSGGCHWCMDDILSLGDDVGVHDDWCCP